MEALPSLPLPIDQLPASLARFADPKAPEIGKMMAAKGLVPVKGAELVTLLVQLAADPAQAVATTAKTSLGGLPDEIVLPACEAPLHPSIAHEVAETFRTKDEVLERLMLNPSVAPNTVVRVAHWGSERITEVIATNQERVLKTPEIIEALYKNKNTRMSTVDRLVELAARHDVAVPGIPSFQAHVDAIRGQLIPEPTDEPLPSDLAFVEAMAEDSEDADVVETTKDGDVEQEGVKDQFKPLSFRIQNMSLPEKLRFALVGNAAARALLVRDRNKQVSFAAISSPQMTAQEAEAVAGNREIGEDILRFIAGRREWLKSYELKKALVFNPKTPVGISLRFLSHMRTNDLRDLSRSKNVSAPIKSAALQRMSKKKVD
ncbi:MAG: hypothetical protein KC416_10065 [Myxococcales bacterium]|nr:hypothetical protein [Myxococcales bacterium]